MNLMFNVTNIKAQSPKFTPPPPSLTTIHHHVKKNQLDAQLILSIFHQPLHISGVSRPVIKGYNRMYTTTARHQGVQPYVYKTGTYYSFR
jgi:hypothetical protein